MKYLGTYKGISVIGTESEKQYWEETSLSDRSRGDRYYMVKNKLIFKNEVVAERDSSGYITPVSPYKFLREGTLGNMSKTASIPVVEKKTTEQDTRAETELDIAGRKAVDEYLASKKSVDYFFEEIKKEASSI